MTESQANDRRCCQLCRRAVGQLSKHHCIPRTRHKNKRNKRLFDRREIHERVLWLCRPCHKMVHATLTEKELELHYNTLESLLAHAEIAAFVQWIQGRPDGKNIRVRTTERSRYSRRAGRRPGRR